jgi:hypothetical protein
MNQADGFKFAKKSIKMSKKPREKKKKTLSLVQKNCILLMKDFKFLFFFLRLTKGLVSLIFNLVLKKLIITSQLPSFQILKVMKLLKLLEIKNLFTKVRKKVTNKKIFKS